MTTPHIICPLCSAISPLQASTSLFAWTPRWSTVTFVCGACGAVSAKTLDPRLRPTLEAAGIAAVGLPEAHPERPPAGARLTRDDLLTLHLKLQEEDWFAQLQQLVSP